MENMERIEGLIRDLADQLGTTAGHLWEVLIRQSYIDGAGHIMIGVVITVISVFALKYGYKGWLHLYNSHVRTKEENGEKTIGQEESEGLLYFLAAVLIGCTGMATGLMYSAFHSAATCLINPEYNALKEIIGHIPGAGG